MVFIASSFTGLTGNTPTNTVYIAGPRIPIDVIDTTSGLRAGMQAVPDTGTYANGVKLLANATANYQMMVVIDIKSLPDTSDAVIPDPTDTAEQYEQLPALLLVPGLCFWGYVADDGDATIGTTKFTADATTGGGFKTITLAKGGAYVKIFEPIDGFTSNTNQLQAFCYAGCAVDGEA